ncbi:MAG: AAA family ATPase [Chloroflexota bacterium]
MKLQEIQLTGFGKLVGRSFKFGPGLNIVFGPNEAGKSTLQNAILGMLYGFFGEGAIKAQMRQELEAFKPWNTTSRYEGTLTYGLDDGRAFSVTRRLGPRMNTVLTSYPDGTDLSRQYESDSNGRLYFADQQLGMSREVFFNTCHIRQSELIALQQSANAITDALMRLSTSAASVEGTASEAIEALEKASREQVGTDRAWTKPLPLARNRLRDLEKERADVQQQRREMFDSMSRLRSVEQELESWKAQRAQLRYLQLQAEHNSISRRILEVQQAADELDSLRAERDRLAEWAWFPSDSRDTLIDLRSRQTLLMERLNAIESRTATADGQLQTLGAELAAASQQLAALPMLRDLPANAQDEVQSLSLRLSAASQTEEMVSERHRSERAALADMEDTVRLQGERLKPLIAIGHGGLAELEQALFYGGESIARATRHYERANADWQRIGMTEDQFRQLEQTAMEIASGVRPTPQARKGCSWPFGSAPASANQTSADVTIYGQIKPLHDALAAASAELETARTAMSQAQASLHTRLGPILSSLGAPEDTSGLVRCRKELNGYLQASAVTDQRRAAMDQLDRELKEASAQVIQARTNLTVRFGEIGFTTGNDDPKEALRRFSDHISERAAIDRTRQQIIQQIERGEQRQQQFLRDISERTAARAPVRDVGVQLRDLLAQAHIEYNADADLSGGLDQAVARFNDWATKYAAWASADAAYRQASQRTETPNPTTTATISIDDQSRLAALNVQLAAMAAAHPERQTLPPASHSHDYAQQEWQVESHIKDLQREYDGLGLNLSRTTQTMRHPAEIDEDIALVRSEISRLEAARRSLDMAAFELRTAMAAFQKQFAPKLELLVSEGLSQITRQRYSQVKVDPISLAVRLHTPELDDLVDVERLSAGTRDLVYLMLRVAIARLMSRGDEALPLLLDDPLVHLDTDRQQQALGFLADLAKGIQVLFFTKDDRALQWVQSQHPEAHIHLLRQP